MSKVTFDGLTKIISINTGVTTIDVAVDMYSEWKKWVLIDPNSGWDAAFRVVGGDVIGANQYVPSYFFLINNWKVKVENLSVNFSTNLYSDNYINPFNITNSSVYVKNSDVPVFDVSTQLSAITNEISGITNDINQINITLDEISMNITGLTIEVNDIARNLLSVLGLSQSNYRLKNHVYDKYNRLLTCDIKLYNNATDCDNDTNVFEIYQMDAVYDTSGNLIDYKVVKL